MTTYDVTTDAAAGVSAAVTALQSGELVVLPTYTAMLALRRIVSKRGHVPHYWERAA